MKIRITFLLLMLLGAKVLPAQENARPGFNNAVKVSFLSPFFRSWSFSYERMLTYRFSVNGLFAFSQDKTVVGGDADETFDLISLAPRSFSAHTAHYNQQWGAGIAFRYYLSRKGFPKPGGFHLGLGLGYNTRAIAFTGEHLTTGATTSRTEKFSAIGLISDVGVQVVIKKRLLLDLYVTPGLYNISQKESGDVNASQSGMLAVFGWQAMLGFAF